MAFANVVGTLLLVLPGREKRAFYTAVFTGISTGGFLLLGGIISWCSRGGLPFSASEILQLLMIFGWFVGLPTLFAASLTWIERRLNR